jgi:hypothetical protein
MTKNLPVYILHQYRDRNPVLAERGVAWESICNLKHDIIFIEQDYTKKRHFVVRLRARGKGNIASTTWEPGGLSAHYTIEAAEKAAKRWAKVFAPKEPA